MVGVIGVVYEKFIGIIFYIIFKDLFFVRVGLIFLCGDRDFVIYVIGNILLCLNFCELI